RARARTATSASASSRAFRAPRTSRASASTSRSTTSRPGAELGFAPEAPRRCHVDAALCIEYDAVDFLGGPAAPIPLAHVVRHRVRVALDGGAEAAAAAGSDGDGVAPVQALHQHLGVRQVVDLLALDAQRDLVAGARQPA